MDRPVFDFWNKLIVDIWSNCARQAENPFTWFMPPDKGKGPWQIPIEMANAISDSFAAVSGGKKFGGSDTASLSELVLNLMQTGFAGYIALQKRWLDDVHKGVFPFREMESLSHAPLTWLESVRKLLDNISKVGERGSSEDLLAKYAAFSAKMSELLYQLYLPMDKASRAWAEKIDDMQREGSVPQDIEQTSGVWFSVLEGCYLDLLKSPGYTQLLHEAADAYEQYRQVRRQVYGPSSEAGPEAQDRGVEALSDEISKLREKLEELLQKVDAKAGNAAI